MTTLFWQLIRTDPAARDAAKIAAAIESCTTFWGMLDAHLATRDFVVGSSPSMADIPLGCSAYRWHSMAFDRPDLPNLKAWWARLADRPAYRTHVMLPLT